MSVKRKLKCANTLLTESYSDETIREMAQEIIDSKKNSKPYHDRSKIVLFALLLKREYNKATVNTLYIAEQTVYEHALKKYIDKALG